MVYRSIKYNTELGRRISEICKERWIRTDELAEKSGLSRATIQGICMGRHLCPRVDTVDAIAKALKVPPEYLLWGVKDENRFLKYTLKRGE